MANIVKIAIAQINCVVGDLAGNAAKILRYCEDARAACASLILTPELALCGYPPEDLLLRDGFYRDCADALSRLAEKVAGSSDAFVELMNAKAKELGMTSTVFHSVHGLPPSRGQEHDVTTARLDWERELKH